MSEITVEVPRKSVKRLRVKDADGSTLLTSLTTRRLTLSAGRGVLITGDAGTGTITLSSPSALRGHDPYYVKKYKNLLYGTPAEVPAESSPWPHPAYRFTEYTEHPHAGSSSSSSESQVCARYIATINKMQPHRLDGAFFLEGGACWQVGCFDDSTSTSLNLAKSGSRGLTLENRCMPSVDCRDYWVLHEMMERLRMFLQNNRDKNCCIDGEYKLFEQWKATVHYWNYLMYMKKAGVTARALRAGIAVSARYEHLCCNPTCSANPDAVPEPDPAPGWVCQVPLVFHMRIERLTCHDVPLKYTLYVSDVTTNPRNMHYATASVPDSASTFPSSSSSSESSAAPPARECLTTGGSFEVFLSMLDTLHFRDYVEGQITVAVTIPDGAKTPETLSKLYACGGAEGAIKFKIMTEWAGACPVTSYAEEEIWVKLLMDDMDVNESSWACGKDLGATPFLATCVDYGVNAYAAIFESRTTITGSSRPGVEAAIDDWCLTQDGECPSGGIPGIPCGCFRSALGYDPSSGIYSMSALHCCQ